MDEKKSFFVFLVLIVSVMFMCASAQAESGGIGSSSHFGKVTINEKAPQFTLPDTKNKVVKLSDFKGKYVVLEWFNLGCPFVKKHYNSGNMQKLQKEYTDKGVIWLAINSSASGRQGHESALEYNRDFAEKNAVPTAILIDADGKVGHLYNAKTTPSMYVIDPQGILIYAGAIDDTAGVDQSEIATAKNYVKAALDESMFGRPVTTAETTSYGCSVKYAE